MDSKTALIIQGMDVAGMPYRIESAINEFVPDWQAYRFQSHSIGYGFPSGRSYDALEDFADEVDVVHYHHAQIYRQMSGHPALKDKPAVVTIHGEPDRSCPAPVPDHVVVTAIMDPLIELYPQARFIPNFVIEDDLPMTSDRSPRLPLSIYCPPGHHLKKNDLFQQLAKDCPFAKFVYNPKRPLPNYEVLRTMADCDIVWDYLTGGISCTMIEAMALGKAPIFSGHVSFSSYCPLYGGSQEKLNDFVTMYSAKTEALEAYQAECHRFWRENLRAESVVQLYAEAYDDALDQG